MKKGFIKELLGLAKKAPKVVPLVGDYLENRASKDGGEGNVNYAKLVTQIIRLALFAASLYLMLKGESDLTIEDLKGY